MSAALVLADRITRRLQAGRARRRAAAELRGMGPRELADLGVGASELPALLAARPPRCVGETPRCYPDGWHRLPAQLRAAPQ